MSTINELVMTLRGYMTKLSDIVIRLELPTITTKEAKELIEKDIASIYLDYNRFVHFLHSTIHALFLLLQGNLPHKNP
jgi:hypothetical protein